MSFLTDLRDKYLVKPVADRLMTSLKAEKADTPYISQVPYGFNQAVNSNNRNMSTGSIEPKVLRNISVMHETSRAAINVRKRQITQLDWSIVDIEGDEKESKTTAERKALKTAVENIGGEHVNFRVLISQLIEDLLVLDGFVFYKQRTAGGKLLKIIPIDPATIKMRVGDDGSIPEPPDAAYEQWIYGKKVAELSTDDLSYNILNPRTNTPYGLSPIESLITIVDASMRATLYNTNYLNDNNVPAGFLSMPEGWTPNQIKEYKEFFDAMLTGSKNTSKVFPTPHGAQYQPTTKPNDFAFKDFFDYLDRKVCMLFDVTPQELGLSLQQYKENAKEQGDIQVRKGIKPLANFIEEIFTKLIQQEWGYSNYKFMFGGLDGSLSAAELDTFVRVGVLSVDEVREEIGKPKLNVDNFIVTAQGAVFLKDLANLPALPAGTSDTTQVVKPDAPDAKATPDKNLPEQKMAKIVEPQKKGKTAPRNINLEILSKQPKYKKFRAAINEALTNQLQVFTDADKVADLMSTQKAEASTLKAKVAEMVPDFEVDDWEEYETWAAKAGVQAAYNSLNLTESFTFTTADMHALLGEREAYLIDSVNQTTKDTIVQMIQDGKINGLTNNEIAEQFAEQLPDIAGYRADMIVRTEVNNAIGTAQFNTFKDNGVTQKRWVHVDGCDCVACVGNAAMDAIDIDGTWLDTDDNDIDHEPAHPNCLCYTEPVIGDSLMEENI
jgi:phage portal protein BeeE